MIGQGSPRNYRYLFNLKGFSLNTNIFNYKVNVAKCLFSLREAFKNKIKMINRCDWNCKVVALRIHDRICDKTHDKIHDMMS